MKKILLLLVILMAFTMAGCFNENKVKQNQMGLEKIRVLMDVEKRAEVSTVKNGIYITGVTTQLYTFNEFLELSTEEQAKLYANIKAFIVYKDKYIDMVTFFNDINVNASSFLNGTNGVKAVVDETVIPIKVRTKAGIDTMSRIEKIPGAVIKESFSNRLDKIFFYSYDFIVNVDSITVDGLDFIGGTLQAGTLKISKGAAETVFTGKLNVNQDIEAVGIVIKQGINAAKLKENCTLIPPATTTLSGIEITVLPAKTTYYIGEKIDLTGLVVIGTYGDNTTRQAIVTSGAITGFDSTKAGTKKLVVTVGNKTASFDVTVNIFVGEKYTEYMRKIGFLSTAAYSPVGKYIATSMSNETIKIWNFETGAEIRTLKVNAGLVDIIIYSPDGKYIAVNNRDKGIKIWNTETGAEVRTILGNTIQVYSISYSPDGKYIASGGYDNKVRIWNIETGIEERSLIGHNSCVDSISYSPDGKYIVSVCDIATRRPTSAASRA